MMILVAAASAGVLCVGTHADTVGRTQSAIERRIESVPGMEIKGAAQLAPILGTSASADPPGWRRDRGRIASRELLARARHAHSEGRAAEALARLKEIEAIQPASTSWWPVSEQVQLRLWRATVLQTLGDSKRARAEARAALALQPDLDVDFAEFPREVGALVADVRETGLRGVHVVLHDLPPEARIEVDGRSEQSRFDVLAGRHQLVVRADHYEPYESWFEATEDVALSVRMSVKVPPATDELVQAVVAQGTVQEKDAAGIGALFEQASVDMLVLCVARGGKRQDLRAVVLKPADGRFLSKASKLLPLERGESTDELTQWIATALTEPFESAPQLARSQEPSRSPSCACGKRPTSTKPGSLANVLFLAAVCCWAGVRRFGSGAPGSG